MMVSQTTVQHNVSSEKCSEKMIEMQPFLLKDVVLLYCHCHICQRPASLPYETVCTYTELSQPPYSAAAHLASGRLRLFTQSPGQGTVKEGAWPDALQLPLSLPLGQLHWNSNPIPSSAY